MKARIFKHENTVILLMSMISSGVLPSTAKAEIAPPQPSMYEQICSAFNEACSIIKENYLATVDSWQNTPLTGNPFKMEKDQPSLPGSDEKGINNISNDNSPPPPSPQFVIEKKPITYPEGAANYAMLPTLTREYGFSVIDQLHNSMADYDQERERSHLGERQAWVSFSSKHLKRQDAQLQTKSVLSYTLFGTDVLTWKSASEHYFGLMAGIGHLSAHNKELSHNELSRQAGKANLTAMSVGGYYTLKNANASYITTAIQGTHYAWQAHAVNRAKQQGHGATISLDIGKNYLLSGKWSLSPQAQLIYQYLDLQPLHDGKVTIKGTRDHAVRAKVGGRFFLQDTLRWQPYIGLDVMHDMTKARAVNVGDVNIQPTFSRSWWISSIGITAPTYYKALQLNAGVNYGQTFAVKNKMISGNINVAYAW